MRRAPANEGLGTFNLSADIRHQAARASERLAAFTDIGKLSLQMGNSASVIHAAYKGLVSKTDVERFLALRPDAGASEKIVAMKAVANV